MSLKGVRLSAVSIQFNNNRFILIVLFGLLAVFIKLPAKFRLAIGSKFVQFLTTIIAYLRGFVHILEELVQTGQDHVIRGHYIDHEVFRHGFHLKVENRDEPIQQVLVGVGDVADYTQNLFPMIESAHHLVIKETHFRVTNQHYNTCPMTNVRYAN